MDARVSWDALHDGRAYALVSNRWRILMMITTSDHMLHGTLTLTNVSEHVVHRSSDGMETIHAAMAAMLLTSYAHVACVNASLHMYMCQRRLLHTWFMLGLNASPCSSRCRRRRNFELLAMGCHARMGFRRRSPLGCHIASE